MNRAVDALLASVAEAGVAAVEYGCRICRTSYPDWRDRCEVCGSWSTVDLRLGEELLEGGVPGDLESRTSALYHGEFDRPDDS